MALGDHAVLQLVGPAPHQVLQSALALLALALQLPAQPFQCRAGPIGHAAPVFEGKTQLLFQLRQGAQPLEQSGGHRPEFGVIHLAPQPAGSRQGVGQLQQGLAAGAAPLGAELHGVAELGHALQAQPSFQQAIEGQQLAGFL